MSNGYSWAYECGSLYVDIRLDAGSWRDVHIVFSGEPTLIARILSFSKKAAHQFWNLAYHIPDIRNIFEEGSNGWIRQVKEG